MGAEALAKFLARRLDRFLSEETEIFSGVRGQILELKSKLDEIGCFLQTINRIQCGNGSVRQWIRELRDTIDDAEDLVDQLIIAGRDLSDDDESEKALLIISRCESDLETVQARLTQILSRKPLCDSSRPSIFVDAGDGEESVASLSAKYRDLPYYLRSCLIYCCLFPLKRRLRREELTRILMAEGVVQEKPGEVMEDVGGRYIDELVRLGMLQTELGCHMELQVPYSLRRFLVDEMVEEKFMIACSPASEPPVIPASTVRHLSIHNCWNDAIPSLCDLPIRSLFVLGIKVWELPKMTLYGLKYLRVIMIECIREMVKLPGEIGDLVHLKYLGLKSSSFRELPEKMSNLRSLQTLEARFCPISSLPDEVLNCVELRHLLMSQCELPTGIGRLKSLQSVEGVYAGGSVSRELGCLTQLRKLGVLLSDSSSDDEAGHLYTSIMKMSRLLSLNLTTHEDILNTWEPFSPPPLLRKLKLDGRLVSLPHWVPSTETLTKLRLGFSRLSENPNALLQFLPNLKHLTLWEAYNAKRIGKEFCPAGGFLKLEVLVVASRDLVEWCEIEEGALPSLKCLHFHSCSRLMLLPEGLQYVTTLQKLNMFPLHGDHARRLDPQGGTESYKIKHIPDVRYMEFPYLESS